MRLMQKSLSLTWVIQLLISVAAVSLDSQGLQLRQQEQACTELRTRIAQQPGDPNLHLQLATTLHGLDQLNPNGGKRIPEADKAYREVIRLAPAHATVGVYTNLGALLMGAGQLEDCLLALHTSIALAKQYQQTDSLLYSGALFNLGKALDMQGNASAAADAYLQAIEASRGAHGSTYTKAFASLKTYTPDLITEMEQASRALRQAPGQDITDHEGKGSKGSRGKRRRRSDAQEEDEEGQWAFLTGLSAVDQSWLHFALYSALQQQRKFEEAWKHLEEGNKLQHATAGYSPDHENMLFDVIKQVFQKPADVLSTEVYDVLLRGELGYHSASPIFVVGMPRSGSTLVEQMLSSHPQACGAGEDTAFAPLLPELLHLLQSQGEAQEVEELGRRYVAEMRQRVPKDRSKGSSKVVDKMLRNIWNVGYIKMMLPQACVIQVVRHPLDTALSCYAQPFEGRGTPWAWDLADIAHEILAVDRAGKHWQTIFPGQVLVMPYERLVADFKAAAEDVLEHCDMPWDDAVLHFHQTQRNVHTASLAQVRQRLYNTSVGKWHQYAKQLQPAADLLKPLVQEYEATHAAYLPAAAAGRDEL